MCSRMGVLYYQRDLRYECGRQCSDQYGCKSKLVSFLQVPTYPPKVHWALAQVLSSDDYFLVCPCPPPLNRERG
jgi:hypothetical protein